MNCQFFRITFIFGCVICCLSLVQAHAGDPVRILNFMNDSHSPLNIGQIVVLKDGRPKLIVDLLGKRPLNDPGAWSKSKRANDTKYFRMARETVCDACRQQQKLSTLWFWPGDAQKEQLTDPFRCLEILNRRLTGLRNNAEAEFRIQQWRTTLMRYLGNGADLYLCVGVTRSSSPIFVISSNETDKTILAFRRKALSGTQWERVEEKITFSNENNKRRMEHVLGVKPLVYMAELRRLDYINESLAPFAQIGFTFADDLEIGVQSVGAIKKSSTK